MQPLGRKPVKFPSKTDCHPGKGLANWWEVEIGTDENKAADKAATKKLIVKELNTKDND